MIKKQQTFTIDEILNLVEIWVFTGELNPDMLEENFHFSSPFWQKTNRAEFLVKFADPKVYQETALSKITHFDPVIQLKSADGKHFAIVFQHHTKNGGQVYEAVLGAASAGLITEMRSIYDLEETKKALDIN